MCQLTDAYTPEPVRHKRLEDNDLRHVLNKKMCTDDSYSPASPPPTFFSPPSPPVIPLYREGEEDVLYLLQNLFPKNNLL